MNASATAKERLTTVLVVAAALIDADGRPRYVAYGAVEWDSDDVIRQIEALMPGGKAVQQVMLD